MDLKSVEIRKYSHKLAAFVAIGLSLATAVFAQTSGEIPTYNSADALNLPPDLEVFGKRDPNLHRATAIVNGAIITDTDVNQRLALIRMANNGRIPDDEMQRLSLQIFRNLVDETLQIQEATNNKISISQDEIDQAFARVAANSRRSPEEFSALLRQNGSSPNSIKKQIEGELAWRRLLARNVEPFVSVSEEEVKAVIDRLNAAKGSFEYNVGEIYLSSTPTNAQEVANNAARIVEQVRKGGSFVAYARQYSEASTAPVGGNLGWVQAERLPEQLAVTLPQMAVGQISDPIALPGGFSILALLDKRQVLTSDPRDALLSLKQITLSLPDGTTRAQAAPKLENFSKAIASLRGCGEADKIAEGLGAEVVDNDQVKVRDLPPQLQQIMLNLQVGEATPPFGSLEDGIRTLVICGRDEASSASAPSYDEIFQQKEEEKVNRRAQRYLRDLRRDAIIEYR